MLTIPFNLFGFADQIVKEPAYVVFLSTFGMFIPFIAVTILKQIPMLKMISNILAGTIALSIFPNFAILMMLIFLNISGIHMFLTGIIVILNCFFFIIFNYQLLAEFMQNPFSGIPPEKLGQKRGKK
ncbi:hypothetical protein [Xenorhabdus taiwanensis]|uniref:Uncharacterized protein n=1 Tax=Xenorhabdus taiwanensis TaxID=3085177 RepID=A0ABM8JQU8_9GAMM|nr:hypothetical protein TCT1_00100 [Xenorhabdus sp. TCT-1]